MIGRLALDFLHHLRGGKIGHVVDQGMAVASAQRQGCTTRNTKNKAKHDT
jgi:hypothetical protein